MPPPLAVCGVNTNYEEHSGGKKYSSTLGKPVKKVKDSNACAGLCDKNVQCEGYVFKDNKKVAKRQCTLVKQGGTSSCAKTEVCCKTKSTPTVVGGGQSATLAGATWEKHDNSHFDPGCSYPAGIPSGFTNGVPNVDYCAEKCLEQSDCTGFHLIGADNCQYCTDSLSSQTMRGVSAHTLYYRVDLLR
jgi:hypothetical protein